MPGFQKNDSIIKLSSRLIIIFMILFGGYLAVNGEKAPGGGFAGGIIAALAYILTVLVFSKETALKQLSSKDAVALLALGGIFYLSIGFMGISGSYFFSNILFKFEKLSHIFPAGIIALENIAIALITACAVILIFNAITSFNPFEEKGK
jgi:multisubunit Na+/H+ antiporter MnhB subunit